MKEFGTNELKHRIKFYEKENEEEFREMWSQMEQEHSGICMIRVRKPNIKQPSTEGCFMKDNLKFKIISYIPDPKHNAYWEFKCKLIS